MSRITWTRLSDSLERGDASKRAVFTLSDLSTADDPLFALGTQLPTGGRILWKRADPEALKKHAEKVLAAFVAELGAVFPTNTEET